MADEAFLEITLYSPTAASIYMKVGSLQMVSKIWMACDFAAGLKVKEQGLTGPVSFAASTLGGREEELTSLVPNIVSIFFCLPCELFSGCCNFNCANFLCSCFCC